MKHLLYAACALVLIVMAALLPASAAPPTGGIDVEKYVSVDGGLTWLDADVAPGPTLPSTGPAPQFRFNVTNLGGSALTSVALTDNVLGAITVPGNLVGGASVEVIVAGTWAAGQHTNVATATGTKGSDIVTDSDAANYFGLAAVQPPTAAFSAVPTTGVAPLAVQFTDASTGSGITAWSWTFGDGGASTEQSPSHTYTVPGTYTVNLTVTNAGGSDDELKTDYITVTAPPVPPVAAFSATPTTGVAPLAVTFTDGSTGTPTSWAWDFGDGGASNEQNPSHTYTVPGTYTVNLTVTNADGTDSEVKVGYITVSAAPVPPVAAFTGAPTSGVAPLTVQFTDASTGAPTSWGWAFGDGGTSSEQSPSHAYTVPGIYTVNLTVTNADGSDDELKTDYITVTAPPEPPVAAFSAAPTSGDAPLAVTFTDESTGGVITAWSWTFGDGGASSEQSPSHAYTVPGIYSVNLTVTNADGSDDELKTDYITVAVPPNPSVSIEVLTNGMDADTPPGPSITAGAPVQWTYVVTNTGNVRLTNVAVIDDRGVVVSAPKTVLEPGETMTATASGTAVAGQYANVGTVTGTPPAGQAVMASDPSHYFGLSPLVAAFTGTPTSGVAPLAVTFTDASTGAPTAWAWDFENDGTVDSTLQNPAHTYPSPGAYTVNLTVTSADGSDSEVKTDYVTVTAAPVPPVAAFTGTPTSGVAPLAVTFTDESTGAPASWSWTFGDGATSAEQSPVHTYTAPGTYSVNLTVTNADGSDSELKTDYVTVTAAPVPPVAAFSGAPTSGVAPLTVWFTDTSTGNPTAWNWNFGDGSGSGVSTAQNPSHTYMVPGTYSVNLTVTNADGSDDELKTDYITVTAAPVPPVAAFSGAPTSGVAPLAVTFTDASTGAPASWSWSFGDGVTSVAQNPVHTYTAPGAYTVSLTVTNADGSDSEVKAGYITVTARVETEPFPRPHVPAMVIEAEDYDLGGEGVAYHDVEPANLGGRYRSEGVDIETEAGVTNVGWIRAGEYLDYTVDTTIAGDFFLTLRAANPDAATKAVTVYLDGVPAGQVMVGRTGAWTTFADFTMAAPMTIPAGRHVVTLSFEGISRINIDWLRLAAGVVPTGTPAEPTGASFSATPVTAPRGAAVKFTLTPAPGKTVKAAWWSFDAPTHLNTWNSRTVNPTFFYPRTGTFSPLVRITYTDNTVEEVHRLNYVRAT